MTKEQELQALSGAIDTRAKEPPENFELRHMVHYKLIIEFEDLDADDIEAVLAGIRDLGMDFDYQVE